jgi:hypothetical protein
MSQYLELDMGGIALNNTTRTTFNLVWQANKQAASMNIQSKPTTELWARLNYTHQFN